MANSSLNPKVNAYIRKAKKWQPELEALRAILLESGLTEELKWGKPCYLHGNSNVVIIQDFKEYFALLFFKGILLKDPKGILLKTGENTHVGRQLRFTSAAEIVKMKATIKAYIKEAVEAEKAGLQVPEKELKEIVLPEELKKQLNAKPALKKAFHELTPGRQKGYLFYFNQAKQAATRQARVEKCIPQILAGKGLND